MTAPREVNAERAMHLRAALDRIAATALDQIAVRIAMEALAADDAAIEIAEQDAFKDPDET